VGLKKEERAGGSDGKGVGDIVLLHEPNEIEKSGTSCKAVSPSIPSARGELSKKDKIANAHKSISNQLT